MKKLLSILLLNCFAAELFCTSATQPLEEAHYQLWSKFVGNDGIVLDYVGELPNAKDVEDGNPNYLSWWTPIENGAKFTGLYLAAMCRRAEISKSGEDKKKAEKLFSGLMKCASCSDVSGIHCARICFRQPLALSMRLRRPDYPVALWHVCLLQKLHSKRIRPRRYTGKIHASMQRTGRE